MRPGQQGRLLIRPEHVLLGDRQGIPAVIDEVVYLGELTALNLRLDSGQSIWARQIADRSLRRGDSVRASWKHESPRVVPDN